MKGKVNRREFLTHGLAGSAGLYAVGATAEPSSAPGSVAPNCKGTLPMGKIGKIKVSRLISGGNLLSGWCHQRDLLFVRNLAAAYLTPQKQFDTLQMLEELGVNAIMVDMIQMEILNRYRAERQGKAQAIASVREGWGDWSTGHWDDLKTEIKKTIDAGAALVYLHGGYCDRLVQAGKPENLEVMSNALQFMRQQGLAAGIGAHDLGVLKECDRRGIKADFYVKTFHHDRYWSAIPKERRKPFSVDGPLSSDHNEFHDNIFCLDAEGTADYMLDRPEPWIAFKVLAAGAILPKSGFKYAFENGADFIAVGMFDFQIRQNCEIAQRIVRREKDRLRPWRA